MRLFIALPIPEELQHSLDSWWQREKGLFPGWRTMRPENRHLTLHFLGDVSDKRLDELSDTMGELFARTPVMQLVTGGAGFFPSPSRAQTFWVGVEEETGELQHCARSCRHLCQSVQGRSGKSTKFRAHITLARSSEKLNESRLLEQLSLPPEFGWQADEAHLIQSQLHPHGARYQVVERFMFGSER